MCHDYVTLREPMASLEQPPLTIHNRCSILWGIEIFLKRMIFLRGLTLEFVLKGSIDKKSALVLVAAWYETGDKPLYESKMN